jgi:tripartite-type tricarboxylate transporter receptor subunit TctC
MDVKVLLAACAALWLGAAERAVAQVQVIIPFPTGGATDIIGRLIQPTLAEQLGTGVVIRNVGGATGTIGAAEVARAKPDGTMLMLTSMAPVVVQPSFRPSIPYRTDSFAPVCLVADAPAVLMTTRNSGLRSVADVVARARAAPGQVPFASGGVGGMGHIAMTGLIRATGIEMNHIPFRGSGDAIIALQSGTVLMLAAEANLVKQYELHPIGAFAEQRLPQSPDMPTMREQGHDLVFALWTGLYAPANTPEPVLARLEGACERTLRAPAIGEGMARLGHPIRYLGRREFTEFTRAEAAKYHDVIEAAGMRQAD